MFELAVLRMVFGHHAIYAHEGTLLLLGRVKAFNVCHYSCEQ